MAAHLTPCEIARRIDICRRGIERGTSRTEIAREIGVAYQTLNSFLRRHDPDLMQVWSAAHESTKISESNQPTGPEADIQLLMSRMGYGKAKATAIVMGPKRKIRAVPRGMA